MRNQALPQRRVTAGQVQQIVRRSHLSPEVLRWLIWIPLLSPGELARCTALKTRQVYERLMQLERAGAVEHVTLSEPGVARHQRYYVSDAGLYAFAEHFSPALDVGWLAASYPVTERDLFARLLRPAPLLSLADVASRLEGEGRPSGYRLVGYQQPWRPTLTLRGTKHRPRADAAFSLATPEGGAQGYCILVDTGDEYQAPGPPACAWLGGLFAAMEAAWWQGVALPLPLILTTGWRLSRWRALIARLAHAHATAVPAGGITTFDLLGQGVYRPIWWPWPTDAQAHEAAENEGWVQPPSHERLSLAALMAASRKLAEQAGGPTTDVFSLAATRPPDEAKYPPRRRGAALGTLPAERPLPRYVRGRISEQAAHVASPSARPIAYTADPLRLYTRLTLALTALEKSILIALSHHALLGLSELASLLGLDQDGPPAQQRTVQRKLFHLLRLGLVEPWRSSLGATSFECERYRPSVCALRFLAARQGLPPTHYLGQVADAHGTHWEQHGVRGLIAQPTHTMGVYRYVLALTRAAHTQGWPRIVCWKSARESIRWYRSRKTGAVQQIRPDGEILFQQGPPPADTLCPVLFEYDRATMKRRDYLAKFDSYLEYWETTGREPPLILVVTQHERARRRIERYAATVSARLPVQVELESALLTHGQLPRLPSVL